MKKSIAALLVELKTLGKRIEHGIAGGIFVSLKVGKTLPAGFTDEAKVKETIKGCYDSVTALVERRNKIKAIIVVSNATTTVDIAGTTYTVADAIERKSSIEYQKQLLNELRNQFGKISKAIETGNKDANARLDEMLKVARGKEGKVDHEADKKFEENFKENNLYSIIDQITIREEIEKLQKYIFEFEGEVDLALSTSNAITEVEVPE